MVVLVHPDGTREPLAIGVPGDREVDPKRLEAPARADRGRAVRRGRASPRTPRWSRATSGREVLGRGDDVAASATWSTRGSSRAPAGSPAPTSPAATWSTWSPVATSPLTAPSRPPRCATATRARPAPTAAGVRPRHRDGPHLPARPQVRRGARPQGARRERQARHRDDGLLRHRRLARGGRDRREHPRRPGPVLAARRRAVRRAPGRRRQGRRGLRGGRALAAELDAAGVEVLLDDRAARSARA